MGLSMQAGTPGSAVSPHLHQTAGVGKVMEPWLGLVGSTGLLPVKTSDFYLGILVWLPKGHVSHGSEVTQHAQMSASGFFILKLVTV